MLMMISNDRPFENLHKLWRYSKLWRRQEALEVAEGSGGSKHEALEVAGSS
jgi:hypothetical protein